MKRAVHPAPFYGLNCGQYVLHNTEGKPIGAPLDEVALVFDKECGVLHKHGPASSVQAWVQTVRQKTESVRGVDGFDLYSDLVVIQGRFPVDMLNRCLDTSGYVLKLYEQLQAGTLPPEPWQY